MTACRPGLNAGSGNLDCGVHGPTFRSERSAMLGVRAGWVAAKCAAGSWHVVKKALRCSCGGIRGIDHFYGCPRLTPRNER